MAVVGLGVAGAAGAFFAIATKQAIDYQDALTKVSQTTNLSEDATKQLGLAVQQMAVGGQDSASTLLNALAPVAGELQAVTGHSLDAASATKVLTAAQNLQLGANTSLISSTKGLVDLLKVYQEDASHAASISDSLFQAHAQLGMGVDRLSMMLARLQPRIAGSGLDLQHLLGIVSEMSVKAGSGQRAMMMVGLMLQNLQNPAKKVSDALHTMGINLLDSKGHFIGLEAEVGKLHNAYESIQNPATRAALLTMLFGHNANIGKTLIEGGTQAIEANTLALQKHGTAAEAAAKQQADLGAQLETMKTDLGLAALAVGNLIIGPLTGFVHILNTIIEAFTRFTQQHPQVVGAFVAIAGAVGALAAGLLILDPAVGHVERLVEDLVSTLGVGGGLMGLLVFGGLGIAAATGMFGDKAQQIVVGFVNQVVTFVQQEAPVVANAIISWFNAMVAWIQTTGIPLVVRGLNLLLAGIVAWIGDGSTISSIVTQLTMWTLGFIGWAAQTGAEVIVGLGAALIRALPDILNELGIVANAIITGIVNAILNNPGAFIQGIAALLALKALFVAIDTAGALLGAAWKVAFQLAAIAVDEFTAALKGMLLGNAVTTAAAEGGTAAGGEFAGSMATAIAASALIPAAVAAAVVAGVAAIAVNVSDINAPQHKDAKGKTFRGTTDIQQNIQNELASIDQLQQRAAAGDQFAATQLASARAALAKLYQEAAAGYTTTLQAADMASAQFGQSVVARVRNVTAATLTAAAQQAESAVKTAQVQVSSDLVALKSATGLDKARLQSQLVTDRAKLVSAEQTAHTQAVAAMAAAHQEETLWAQAYAVVKGTFFAPMAKAAWDLSMQNVAAADQAYAAWANVAAASAASLHPHGRPNIPGITRVGTHHAYTGLTGGGGGARGGGIGGGTPPWMNTLMKELGLMPAKIGHHVGSHVGKHVGHHLKNAVCPPTGSIIVDQHGNPIHKKVEILTPGAKPRHIKALEEALAPGAKGSSPITGSQSGLSLEKSLHFRPTIHVHVYLDGHKVHNAISRHLFHEERRHVGAVSPSSRF